MPGERPDRKVREALPLTDFWWNGTMKTCSSSVLWLPTLDGRGRWWVDSGAGRCKLLGAFSFFYERSILNNNIIPTKSKNQAPTLYQR